MLAKRLRRGSGGRSLVAFVLLACLGVACGGSEFSASDAPAGAGGDSGAGGDAGTGGKAGGGSGGSSAGAGGGSAGSASVSAGCEAYVQAVCEWEGRCGKGLTGSLEACLRLNANSCEWYVLPGSNVSAAAFAPCTADYEVAGCDGAPPTCELPAGSIANGLSCATYLQCESDYCTGANGACGVCAPHPQGKLGAPCTTYANCESTLDCVDGECAEKAREGEACSPTRGCSITPRDDGLLTCVDGTCQVVGGLGRPCHQVGGASFCGPGAACSNGGVCVPLVLAMAGEPCGAFEDEVVDCQGGICRAPEASPEELECIAWAGPGESCNKVPGFSRCAAGLSCSEDLLCVWPTVVSPPEDCR
jgi:hypothetical protein